MNPYLAPFLLSLCFPLFACTDGSEPREIDSRAFRAHFSEQRECMAYVDSMISPVKDALSNAGSIGEMREWLSRNSDHLFSQVVTRVREATQPEGALNPQNEHDRILVSQSLADVLRHVPGFNKASCGPDVSHYVMESLYLGLGPRKISSFGEFHERGITDSWEQKWIVLTVIMADEVMEGWGRK